MASLSEQTAYQAEMQAIATLAIADLVDGVGSYASLSPERAAALVRDLMPELVAEYGMQAADLSADFYDEARYVALGAAAAAGYSATTPPVPGEEVVQDALGWALAPLFAPEAPDNLTALKRSAGKLQKLVAGHGRDTVEWNAANDPVGTRYMRHASANACAFCRMLATREATYLTAESAVRVVGEVDPRSTGSTVRGPRGTQELGEKYHDNCKCIAVPVFPGDRYEAAPHIKEWGNQYTAASRATGTKRADVGALLAKWRELYGAR